MGSETRLTPLEYIFQLRGLTERAFKSHEVTQDIQRDVKERTLQKQGVTFTFSPGGGTPG